MVWYLAITGDMRRILFSCYNASFGGKYELPGQIRHIDELIQHDFVKAAQCRKDPLSTHGAKTCRVLLVRMTDKGISEAQQIVEDKLEVVGIFLKSVDSLPSRIRDLYRYLLKNWLRACENRENFAWHVRNQSTFLPLPQGVRESISKANEDLVEKGLAAYASLQHNTLGPSEPTLVTCHEIRDWLLNGTGWLPEHARARGVRTAVLDEYLGYLLNGLGLVRAKDLLLHFFYANSGKVRCAGLRYLSQHYGVSLEVLWSWLEELEGCEYITQLNQDTKNLVLTGEWRYPEEDIVAYGNPVYFFENPFEDVRRIESEVKNNVEKWFETGEEVFQRFEFKRAR